MSRPRITDPTTLTTTAAADAIRKGELSSEQLVRACLDRIATREGEVQAWEHLDPDLALTQAREADAAFRAGETPGPLHGVPVGVKDIFDTADLPTENGSPIFAGRRPERDASCVAALRSAGAVIMGKTVTTELALLTPARTRNPRNLAHTPGGSSAGSAAAVADGMVPAALGSQTAGSIIRPASFCGVYGFKPTLGLVPRSGVLMQSHTLDTVGVYGRSVEDLALITDCMAAFEGGRCDELPPQPARTARHGAVAPTDATAFRLREDAGLGRGRCGYASGARPTSSAALGERAVEIDIPELGDVIEWQRIVQLAENAHYYGPLMQQAPELVSPGLTQRLETGLAIDAQEYLRAITGREPAYRAVAAALKGFSAILTPAALGPAPEGLGATGSPIMNGLWTYLGMPAVSLPLLEVEGPARRRAARRPAPRRRAPVAHRRAGWPAKSLPERH